MFHPLNKDLEEPGPFTSIREPWSLQLRIICSRQHIENELFSDS